MAVDAITPELFESQEALDYLRCEQDPIYLLEEHGWIIDAVKGRVRFEMWPHVRRLLEVLVSEPRVIVLKARQVGVSETCAGLGIWDIGFHEGATDLFISKSAEDSADLLEKSRFLNRNFPEHIRTTVIGKDNSSRLEFPLMSASIKSFAATKNAGRGQTGKRVVLDEFAHQENASQIFMAVSPTVSAGGSLAIISTANGVSNDFFTTWDGAGGDACPYPFPRTETIWVGPRGPNGYVPVFIPWWARPGRDEDWLAQETNGWADWKRNQEFPANAQDAFAATGRPRFNRDALVPPPGAGVLTPPHDSPLHGFPPGSLNVYEMPRRGVRYGIGADPAEGLVHGDASAAIVVDVHRGIEVASLRGQFEPEIFAGLLHRLANAYTGLLGIERNNHGHAVLLRIRQLRVEDYRKDKPVNYKVYEHPTNEKSTPIAGEWRIAQERFKPGWQTDSKTKPAIIDNLATALHQKLLRVITPQLLLELRIYRQFDDGSTGAPPGRNDDMVMALAIAWQMRLWLSVSTGEVRVIPASGLHAG